MKRDLTKGPVTKSMLIFAGPMILGNLLQQIYNVADTLIVGRFLGSKALAAVGSSFTFITFLTSIILGLCMGSGVVFSMLFGAKDEERLKSSFFLSFVVIGAVTLIINIIVLLSINPLLNILQIPFEIMTETKSYLQVTFFGIIFVFLYNYFVTLLRSIGNSIVPLICLAVAALLNIILDLIFILVFNMGVAGAAWATIIAQGVSAISVALYCIIKVPLFRFKRRHLRLDMSIVKEISQFATLTCAQQSIMNLGILMIQGLVNSFGVAVMAAFSAAVKISSFAYMPVQDFGNAFSTFIAQNFGAQEKERIRKGIRSAFITSFIFCCIISAGVVLFTKELLLIFIHPGETEILAIGIQYLRIEGVFYSGLGFLALFYGYFRGIGKPTVSIILTFMSLGTRVILAYTLSAIPAIGLLGIWWAIPIGWILADLLGLYFYHRLSLEKREQVYVV